MTIDFQSAQNALDRELVRLETLGTLRDALRSAGGLQQASDESGKRLEAALAAETEAQKRLEALSLRVADAQSAAAVEVAKAEQAADVVLTKAKVSAAAIVAGANAESARILAETETKTAAARKTAAALSDAIAKAQGS
jgi:hypothetical protein